MYLFTIIHRLHGVIHVYFQRQKFSFQTYMIRKTGAENRRQEMESIYGAGFWSVCHGCNIHRRLALKALQ